MARYRIPAGVTFQAQTPIAQAISNLGNIFASLPTAEERAFNAARAANAQAEAALNQNRLNAASGIADVFRRALTPGEGVDPETHFRTTLPEIAAIAANAGQYGQIGDMSRVVGANMAGATPRLQTNAMLGAGSPMSATPTGHAAELDQRTRGDNIRAGATIAAARIASERAAELQDRIDQRTLEPVLDENGRTVLVPRAQAAGRQPGVRPTAAAPRAPDNYMLPDGTTVLSANGQTYRHPETGVETPIPSNARRVGLQVQAPSADALTPTQRGERERSALSMDRLRRTITDAVALSADPTNFGAVGAGRRFVQDAVQQARALAQLVSPEAAQRIEDISRRAGSATGTSAFSPDIEQLNMVLNILPFVAADAVAGVRGNGASNRDISLWTNIIGAGGPVSNREGFLARMQYLDQYLTREINAIRADRGLPAVPSMLQQAPPAGAAAPAASPAAGAAAPAASPAAGQPRRRTVVRNPDGSFTIQGQ